MKTFVLVPILISLAFAATAATEPAGRVQLLAPDAARFRDFRVREPDTDAGRQGLLNRLQRYLDERAGPRLAAGTRLEVTLLDVDMAGEFEPNARGEQVRIVRDLYSPRIELSYRILDGGGKALCEGRRSLTDPNFLRHANIADSNDALRHEKALLDDWAARDVPCASPRTAADAPRVEVAFGDLAKFTDFRSLRRPAEGEQQWLAEAIRKHLETEAPKYMPEGARLRMTITDIDMAGDFPPGGYRDVRVVREVYPPRMVFDFTLERADGTVEKQGHREIRDAGFLFGTKAGNMEHLRYEKDLLDGWLQRELGKQRAANANR